MGKSLKFAVIGCGVIGRIHLDRLIKDERVELAAICDFDGEALEKAKDRYKPIMAFNSTKELLSECNFDAAILALPTLYRRELTLKLLEMGKHLLLEKPAGLNEADIEIFKKHCRPGQIVASCSSRFSNSYSLRQGLAWIKEGRIGDVRMIRCRGILSAKPVSEALAPRWRIRREINGGGILSNWGVYDLDFMLSLTGWTFDPVRIFGQIFNIAEEADGFYITESNVESHAVCLLEDRSGVLLHYERAENYPGEANACWEVLGSTGSIKIEMLDPAAGVTLTLLDSSKGTTSKTARFEGDANFDFHEAPLKNFISAILGEEAILTDLTKYGLIARIIDGIYTNSSNYMAEPNQEVSEQANIK